MQVNSSVGIPVLETERLVLRAFSSDDLDSYFAMTSDPETVRYIGDGQSLSKELAWQSLAYLLGHWQMTGFGAWAIEDKATGELIGRVGLYQPCGWPGIELGWLIDRAHWRQGYAYEAIQAVLAWCRQQEDKAHLICFIHPKNLPSINLAAKLEARYVQKVEEGDQNALMFAFDLK